MLELIILFFLLGLVFYVEMLAQITRILGLKLSNYASVMSFESTLFLASRALNLIYLPCIALYIDLKSEKINAFEVAIAFTSVPIILFFGSRLREYPLSVIHTIVKNSELYGTYFVLKWNGKPSVESRGIASLSYFRDFSTLFIVFAYFMYYVTWPMILIITSMYPDYKTFVFSLTAFFTGFASLSYSLLINPKGLYLSKKDTTEACAYFESMVVGRKLAAVLAAIVMFTIASRLGDV